MNKRGYKSALLIGLIIAGIAIVALVLGFLEFFGESDITAENESSGGEIVINENASDVQYRICSDYENQEKCEEDSYFLANSNHSGWADFDCNDELVECKCTWNNNSSCILNASAKENEIEDNFDLKAEALYLDLMNCNSNESICDVFIVGIIINQGTEIINPDFRAYFVDSGRSSLIKLFRINDSFPSGGSMNISYTYENVSFGDLYIKFAVDTTFVIDELDETNNEISDTIGIP